MAGSYDESKDEKLESLTAFEDKYNKIIVALHRYNGGEPKLSISRMKAEHGQFHFAKSLGRLTFDEFAAVARAAKQIFQNHGKG